MNKGSRDWRGTREFNRRKAALQKIIDNPDAEPKDVFRAMEMLDAWVGIPDLKAGIARLTGEVERLTSDARDTEITRLGAEITDLTAANAQLTTDLREAVELLEVSNAG